MEKPCGICPRRCMAARSIDKPAGFCSSPLVPMVARAAKHFGEEPCIAHENGTGAVFFTGCNLGCVFCQNAEISRGAGGRPVTVPRLRDILLRLRDEGADSIDLVTGAHFTPAIAEALSGLELGIPVVWNSSGYESVETLRMLEGLVQIYMPDFKYADKAAAKKYSRAEDYPEVAEAAIKEMFRQVGAYELDGSGLMKKGLLVRHLILPGRQNDAMDIIDLLADSFPRDSLLFSLMSQYTPMPGLEKYPELMRTVDRETNEALIHYMKVRHLDGFCQDTVSASKDMIPNFDCTGI